MEGGSIITKEYDDQNAPSVYLAACLIVGVALLIVSIGACLLVFALVLFLSQDITFLGWGVVALQFAVMSLVVLDATRVTRVELWRVLPWMMGAALALGVLPISLVILGQDYPLMTSDYEQP